MVEEMIYAKSENYTLYKGDCLDLLKQLPDESIDCIITSPPYNIDLKNRKDTNIAHYDNYNDNMSWKEYVDWQVQIVNECERVLKWGGVLFYNHKDKFKEEIYRNPIEILQKSKMKIKQNIIWDRGTAITYNAGMFGDVYENIYYCYKGVSPKTQTQHNILGTIWRIDREMNSEHPAPFPLELPLRCLYSVYDNEENKTILDIFNGSGTTGVASLLLGHKYIGFDISDNYLEMTKKRLDDYKSETSKAQNELDKHFVKNAYVKKINNQISIFDFIEGE